MFKEIKVDIHSISHRGLVFGVGVNDANYQTQPKINGKTVRCPIYGRWCNMIRRCYSETSKIKHPTYNGCTVCDEWLVFSNFKRWMEIQDWVGKHLDKDILYQDNKIYSPTRCLFVSQKINSMMTASDSKRGKYKIGVSINKSSGKFMATARINNKSTNLGYFDNEDDAHQAYKTAKYATIKQVAIEQVEPLRSALLNYKIK